MEQTLKITSVLSDPTRFKIYQYISERHNDVTVQEIADQFEIHPNVARLHLSKLEDVSMLSSETKKTGKGGRPSRLYRLSEEVIQLSFPHRDYKLLSRISLITMMSLGEKGREALFMTGKLLGSELVERELNTSHHTFESITFNQRLNILKNAAIAAGFYPEFEVNEQQTEVYFQIFNCPFKEVAIEHTETVCKMHGEFLRGMFESVFPTVKLIEKSNMMLDCSSCSYQAVVAH